MRQFILEQNPDKSGLIVVNGKDYRYLRQVLRVKPGDMISVRLLDGELKNSTVALVDEKSKKITLQLCADTQLVQNDKSITRGVQASELEENKSILQKEYWLFQFIPKAQKFEQIVRQATECGVKYIVPVIGEYSEKNSVNALLNSKTERIERIIKEARQQSGSPVETKMLSPVKLDKALEEWNKNQNKIGFVLSERDDGDGDIRKLFPSGKKFDKIGIVVGSEGGLSPVEVEELTKKGLFHAVHFSVNILRCETAALYGIAAVQTAVN